MQNEEKTKVLLNNVLNIYRENKMTYYLKEYSNEPTPAFLWSYFGALGMMYQISRLYPEDIAVLKEYKAMLDHVAYYRNSDSNEVWAKYNSGKGYNTCEGTGDIFFDDNIWVARNMLFAYEVFDDKEYLKEAIRVTNFVYTGWNDEIGGLVWNENGLGSGATEQELERGLSANACSIIVSSELYQITGDETYLKWALKFYEFCKKMQDCKSGMYYNGIHTIITPEGNRSNGEINKDLYSYNPGSMIIADILLYKVTGKGDYLSDAKFVAKASYEGFVSNENGIKYYTGYPWFAAILMEAFEALTHYDSDYTATYIDVFKKSLSFAYINYMDEDGLLPSNPVKGFNGYDSNDRQLLTQASFAEIHALIQLAKKW